MMQLAVDLVATRRLLVLENKPTGLEVLLESLAAKPEYVQENIEVQL